MSRRVPKTLLRYPGGKQALAPFIKELLAQNDCLGGTYVEPYAGGAGVAMELLFSGAVKYVHLNDKCPQLAAFWHSLLNETSRFARKILDVPLNIQEWFKMREIVQNPSDKDPFDVGFAFFYLNRTNFSGVVSGGIIGGINQDGAYKMDARFNRVRLSELALEFELYRDAIKISALDAVDFLKYHHVLKRKKVFLYCDPPYYHKGQKLYLNAYGHDDHAAVAEVLQKKVSVPWVVSYDAEPAIVELYKDMDHFFFDLQYSARVKTKGRELFILGPGVKLKEKAVVL